MTTRLVMTLAWRDLQLALTSRAPFLFDILGALSALSLYYFVGDFVRPRYAEGALGFFAFATAGVCVLRLQSALIQSTIDLEREQSSGTLELIFLSPVRPIVVAIGTCLYQVVRGLGFAIIVLVASRFVFGAGLTLGPRAWPGVMCGLLGAAFFFVVLYLISCAVLMTIRQGTAFVGLLSFAIPVLAGAFFPAQILPQPLEALAEAIPLTSAISLVRDGIVEAEFSPERAVIMFGALAVLLPLSAMAFNASLTHAKRKGTLGGQ